MGHAHTGAMARRHIPHRQSTWPFMARAGANDPAPAVSLHGVGVPRRQEVEFTDGSRIWLQRVEREGAPCLFLRELGQPAAGTVVDLRNLVPEIEQELPRTSTRDLPGFIHYSLRLCFKTRDEFLQAVVRAGTPS